NFTYGYKLCNFKDLAVSFLLCQIILRSLTVLVSFISSIFGTFPFSALTLKFFKGFTYLFLYFFFAWLLFCNSRSCRFFTSGTWLTFIGSSGSWSCCSRCAFNVFTNTTSAFFILILICSTTGTANRLFLFLLFNRLFELRKINFLSR